MPNAFFKQTSFRVTVVLLWVFVAMQFLFWSKSSSCHEKRGHTQSIVSAQSNCSVCVAKHDHTPLISQSKSEALAHLWRSAPHPEFHSLNRRGALGHSTTFALECQSISEVSDIGVAWFQSKMARDYTPPASPCSGRQGLRRCHDVYSSVADGGGYFRACQWRFPNGPCEDLRSEYREKLVKISAKHNETNSFPNVRLAFRTPIFGQPAWSTPPELCTRADEIISCEFLSEDRKDGPIHGRIYHAMDVKSTNVKPDIASDEWNTTPSFLYNWESPHAALSGQHLSRLFHYRGDYSLDADYSQNYFQWNNPTALRQLIGDRKDPFMYMFQTRTGLFQPAVPFEQRYSDAAPVAWVASHCSSSNQREQVVQQLLDAGLKIDIMGQCMHNKDFPPDFQQNNHKFDGDYGPNGKHFFNFMSKYKFYLNFENSNCKHYYSEKLRRSLILGIVPILLGHPADHEYILPHKDAAIKVWDFPNATALAEYVNKVAADPALFNKHIAWKSGKRENIGNKFWSYWSSQPVSGKYECQMCWIAYDVHLAKCGQKSDRKDIMTIASMPGDTSCVPTDKDYWGMHGSTLETPGLTP
jgi:hypothetical protein